ncbi:MAG: PilN domain-containing protein [Deltaproteobacteria bacterium]|uniref:PilN domain-containing protein n=1 Tax=Desulfobacula sp. TaxID=2593537 RepID=UPI00198F4A5C|nr:PilN domain-containing protein [Candidatus Desulfobacula maris]MBL6994725.1 PilN domain-containing protein [Desulfobacula sp.]
MQFPELPLDDVRDSVVSNLETYSHLPVDEIYYDVLFSKDKDNGINALLFYAPRKKLDIYKNQLMESGHYDSLECIFPFSYGAGPWYLDFKIKSRDNLKATRKKGLVIQYEDSMELAIYSGISCIDSFLLDRSGEKEKQDKVIQDILADHDMSEEQIAYKNTHTITENNFLNENMGGVALAPFYRGMQHISVDDNLPRIKLFKPMKLLFPLFILLGALMAYMSVNIWNEIEVNQKNMAGVKQEIIALEKEIAPILEAKTALKRAAEYKGDVEDFVLSKPPLFSYINDLARIVPENTWFAHLSYKPGIISMQGEGDDVLKVVESLRNSDKYKEVKLKGAVSRTEKGKDKFMIDLILKDLENKFE